MTEIYQYGLLTNMTATELLRPTTKVLPADARRANRSLVLQHLFRSGPASRADLARASGLTRMTVGDLVSDLIAAGVVVEAGIDPTVRAGKPATLLTLDRPATTTAAVDLSDEGCVRAGLVDVDGHVTHRSQRSRAGRTGAAALTLVLATVRDLLATAAAPVLGVGVASPGVLDRQGVVVEAPNLGWSRLALAAELTAATGVPAHVVNDADAAALGVHTFGGLDAADDAGTLVLTLEQGVGAGLLLDGRLVRGPRGAAGEIGHLTVVQDGGQRCSCGRTGCLETVVAAPRLRASLAAVEPGADPRAHAATVLARAGEILSGALAPVVAALDLSQVLLVGPPDLLDGALLSALEAGLARRTLTVPGPDHADGTSSRSGAAVTVARAPLGTDVALLGAAAAVLAAELGVS